MKWNFLVGYTILAVDDSCVNVVHLLVEKENIKEVVSVDTEYVQGNVYCPVLTTDYCTNQVSEILTRLFPTQEKVDEFIKRLETEHPEDWDSETI